MRGRWTGLAAGLALAASGALAPAFGTAKPVVLPAPSGPEWQLQCVFGSVSQQCAMNQSVLSGDGRTLLARFDIGRIGSADTLFVTVPHNVLLEAGMALSVDGGKPIVFSFELCNEMGCVARIPFSGDVAQMFLTGTVHHILVAGLDGKAASLDFSMNGFAQAYGRYRQAEGTDGQPADKPPVDIEKLLQPYAQ